MDLITSTQNPRIKNLLQLEKARNRKKEKVFVIEGFREIERALQSGYEFENLYYCPEIENFKYQGFVEKFPIRDKIAVSDNVFTRIAYRDKHEGLVATAKMKEHRIEDFTTPENGLYLVIESVEKPGNLGALLRTADAAGLDAVFICDNQTDIYNPNVIRSSLGCLFSNKVIVSSANELVNFFKANEIAIYASALQQSDIYYNADFGKANAIVMGSEAQGLSGAWRENAEKIIRIPMKGIADSLNVSASAAILIFEAIRQRRDRT